MDWSAIWHDNWIRAQIYVELLYMVIVVVYLASLSKFNISLNRLLNGQQIAGVGAANQILDYQEHSAWHYFVWGLIWFLVGIVVCVVQTYFAKHAEILVVAIAVVIISMILQIFCFVFIWNALNNPIIHAIMILFGAGGGLALLVTSTDS